MSLPGRNHSNLLIVFSVIVLIKCAQIVTANINYNAIRHDEPSGLEPEQAGTTRQMLEAFDKWANKRRNYTLQQATEHLLQYGAILRMQILDTFGSLVYDHYDDYTIPQTEALYRVYQETLERKYNIFNIVPSVLYNPDTRPTKICQHIHKYVQTCLKESSMRCLTINEHDNPHPDTILTPLVNITRRIYKNAKIRRNYPKGFSLPAVLRRLKAGQLELTVGLISGLLHNVQYDSFDDEVRTAERNVMRALKSDRLKNSVPKDLVNKVHTVSELLKELFDVWKTTHDRKTNKSFAVLSKHVVREIEAISRNIETLGTVYENNSIDMNYLFNMILPKDVVDRDITEAKDYLLAKIADYDIVRKYLKVEKYRQSGPDQLLMEILGQMRDINFAVDLATALHAHARFWHQSRMINNINELLELFDAYENLRNVPEYASVMSLMDKIRLNLRDSTIVNIEIMCNNPRACLHIGLEIVVLCASLDTETKHNIEELFMSLTETGSIYVEECKTPVTVPTTVEVPQVTGEWLIGRLTTTTEQPTTDLTTEIQTATKELFFDEAIGAISTASEMRREADAGYTMTVEPTTTTTIRNWNIENSSESSSNEVAIEKLSESSTNEVAIENLSESSTNEVAIERLSESSTNEVAIENLSESSTNEVAIERLSESSTNEVANEKLSESSTNEVAIEKLSESSTMEFTVEAETEASLESTTTENTPVTETSLEILIHNQKIDIPSSSVFTNESTTIFATHESITTDEPTTVLARSETNEKFTTRSPGSTSLPSTMPDVEATDSPFVVFTVQAVSDSTVITSTESEILTEVSQPKMTTMKKIIRKADATPGLDVGSLVEDCSANNCTLKINKCEEDGSCSNSNDDTSEEQTSNDCSGDGCADSLPKSTTPSYCEDGKCSNDSKSDESTCTGDDCSQSDNNRTSTTTVKPESRCDNKDPHHQRKLHRLHKVRLLNSVAHRETVPISKIHAIDSSTEDDSSEELPLKSPRTTTVKPSLLLTRVQPQNAHDNVLSKAVPPKILSKKPIRSKKFRKHGKKNKWRNVNVNNNRNENSMNMGRFLDDDQPDASMTWPTRRQRVTDYNSDNYYEYKKQPAGSRYWNSAGEQIQSDDRIERMRKNRSIIRVPQRKNRRYQAL